MINREWRGHSLSCSARLTANMTHPCNSVVAELLGVCLVLLVASGSVPPAESLEVVAVNVQLSGGVVLLECRENGEEVTTSYYWLKDGDILMARNGSVVIQGGRITLHGLDCTDEGRYVCCKSEDNCSPGYPLSVRPTVNNLVPTIFNVRMEDEFRITCGICSGSVSSIIKVSWDLSFQSVELRQKHILWYSYSSSVCHSSSSSPSSSSSVGNDSELCTRGNYIYYPYSFLLVVANFEDLQAHEFNLTCSLTNNGPNRQSISTQHTVQVIIYHVAFKVPLRNSTIINTLQTVVRLTVVTDSSGGLPDVVWRVQGEVVESGGRYNITTNPRTVEGRVHIFSSLAISDVMMKDANMIVEAQASLSNGTATNMSRTRLIIIRKS